MHATIVIKKENSDRFSEAEKFYRSVGYMSPIEPESQVVSASINSEFLGVVRLIVEDGHLVLRGMMIAPTHQRNGIGSLMLKELEKHIGSQDCYCLPHGWLEGFYGQIGFVKINDDQAPRHLQDRLKENRTRHPKLIAMKRVAS